VPTPISTDPAVLAAWQLSGLTSSDAKKMKVGLLTANERDKFDIYSKPAMLLPYFDRHGAVLPGFARVRIWSDDEEAPKYIQVGGGTEAYLPPLINWDKTLSDTSRPIFITEGEKKAACATKNGYPCIGLGGVDSYRSKTSLNTGILPIFDEFEWVGRKVYIVFDSDIHENAGVATAAFKLSREMLKRGAKVYIVLLPPSQAKVGLDDYIVEHGTEAFDRVLDRSEQEVTLSSMLEDLKQRIVVLRRGSVYDTRDEQIYSRDHFVRTAFAHWNVEGPPGPRGGKPEKYYVAEEYLDWKHRIDVTHVDTRPDIPTGVFVDKDGRNVLNWFRGWACEPVKGSVKPFLTLIKRLTKGDKAAADYLIGWLAHPLQNPGVRNDVCVVLVSRTNGTGKSTLGKTMLSIYGDNGQHGQYLRPGMLFADFNGWAKACLFAYADEIPDEGRVSHRREAFKALIDQPFVNVNIKNIPEVDAVHRCNYLFTTNNPGAIPMDESDRRFFVLNTIEEYWENEESDSYYDWLHGGGASALFHYLLRYKSKAFVAHRKPPETEAKLRMIESSRPKLGTLVHEFLAEGPPDLFTDELVWKRISGKVGRTSEYTRTTVGSTVDGFSQVFTRKIEGLRVHSLDRSWKALSPKQAKDRWDANNS